MVADVSDQGVPSHLDLIGAQYANDLDGFSARMTVRDLKPRTATMEFTLTFPKSGHAFRVTAARTKAGEQTTVVSRLQGERVKRTCSRFVVSWDDTADRVDVHVPWSCLGDLRTGLRVQAQLAAGRRPAAEPADVVARTKVPYN